MWPRHHSHLRAAIIERRENDDIVFINSASASSSPLKHRMTSRLLRSSFARLQLSVAKWNFRRHHVSKIGNHRLISYLLFDHRNRYGVKCENASPSARHRRCARRRPSYSAHRHAHRAHGIGASISISPISENIMSREHSVPCFA